MKLFKSHRKIALFFEIGFVILLPFLFKTSLLRQLFAFFNSSVVFMFFFKFLFLLRAFLLLHILLVVLVNFYNNVIKKPSDAKNVNIKLLKTSVFSCFIICEVIFMFIPQSQGNVEIGYGQAIWGYYYDRPLNELNYRDYSIKERSNKHKKNILFLGDSFTRGVGIKQNKNCFVSIVRAKTDSTRFEIFNLGKGNSDTKDEFNRLKDFPVKPDILVLQYYHNDIQPVGEKFGYYKYEISALKKVVGGFVYLLSKTSFFINFITINVSVKFIDSKISHEYKQEIVKSYSDSRCLNTHLSDINNVIMYCKANNVKLYVLLIPELVNVDFTENICFKPIKSFLFEKDVDYISIYDTVKSYKPNQLIVGPLDNHANEFTQTIIAEEILKSVPELK